MAKPQDIYDIDDNPPIRNGFLYGLQWAIITFPALIIVSSLSGKAFNMENLEEVRFLQLTLLTSGLFTFLQSLAGHRYPLLDGPATALLITFITLAPYGIGSIQAGTIIGGGILLFVVLLRRLQRVIAYATPNVVGVILMLIAFSLLPHLIKSMTGVSAASPEGEVHVFLISFALVIVMAALSHWLAGFLKTIALLLGILLGTLVFSMLGMVEWHNVTSSEWISVPSQWVGFWPRFHWPAIVAFIASYLAVVVNSLGSFHGIAKITDSDRLPSSIFRGLLLNGAGGILCGFLGLVGTVSYSMSPGVILSNQVASRYAVAYCGVILTVAAFVPKLAALLALVPAPVVGAALCSAMGAQVGAGLAIVSAAGPTIRDYFVVGLPLLLGTLVGFLPSGFMASIPATSRVFFGNGLIVGIFLVLLLEHVVLRKRRN
jgi:xanthine/uracil permease